LISRELKREGRVTLHGRTNSITFDVLDKAGTYSGQARIKQTDFGIQPISVAGGIIKVLNEVKINFVIVVGK
jgi:polyisoprenoid-binding protein YceI